MTQRILIISNDEASTVLPELLDSRGFEVMTAAGANDGYQLLAETRFELVIVNLERAITGADLIKRIRLSADLNQPKVLIIAEWGTGQATLALSQGADGFEPKPFSSDQVVKTVETLLRPRAMKASASADADAIDQD